MKGWILDSMHSSTLCHASHLHALLAENRVTAEGAVLAPQLRSDTIALVR